MLLTLDLATRVGWTLGVPADLYFDYGSHLLPSTGNDFGAFASAFDMWLRGKLYDCGLNKSLCVFEAPILPRDKTTPVTQRKLSGLCWHTEFRCHQMGIEVAEGHNLKVKAFMGSGRMKKDDMIRAIEGRGYKPQNSDEADAIALRLYVIHERYPQHRRAFKLDMGSLGA